MSDDSKRRRGQPSRYLNGGENALMRVPSKPGDEVQGGWTREQLLRMDDCFVVAVERAIANGREHTLTIKRPLQDTKGRLHP